MRAAVHTGKGRKIVAESLNPKRGEVRQWAADERVHVFEPKEGPGKKVATAPAARETASKPSERSVRHFIAPDFENAPGAPVGGSSPKPRELQTRRRSLVIAKREAQRMLEDAARIVRAVDSMRTLVRQKRWGKAKPGEAFAAMYQEWTEVHASMADWGDALLAFTEAFCDGPAFGAFRAEDRKREREDKEREILADTKARGEDIFTLRGSKR